MNRQKRESCVGVYGLKHRISRIERLAEFHAAEIPSFRQARRAGFRDCMLGAIGKRRRNYVAPQMQNGHAYGV